MFHRKGFDMRRSCNGKRVYIYGELTQAKYHTHGPQAPTAPRLSERTVMARVRGDDELMELLGMMGAVDSSERKIAGSQEEEDVRCAKAIA